MLRGFHIKWENFGIIVLWGYGRILSIECHQDPEHAYPIDRGTAKGNCSCQGGQGRNMIILLISCQQSYSQSGQIIFQGIVLTFVLRVSSIQCGTLDGQGPFSP